MRETILLAHPTFGVLGILAALWVVVETLNASPANAARIRIAAYVCTACIVLAWIVGGYFYVVWYGTDKAAILKGAWPWAHNLFMETKEHLFFIPLVLALFLPVAAVQAMTNRGARAVVLAVAGLIVLNGLAIEGAGAVISNGVKVALAQPAQSGGK